MIVDVRQSSMTNAQVGDRVRIRSKVGNFRSGYREYYNLSRGHPPMKPLKRYLDEVHRGADGFYKVVASKGTEGAVRVGVCPGRFS